MNVLSIVSYNILPAKMGGQKGIAIFNEYLSKKVKLYCASVASNKTELANYPIFNVFSNRFLRYTNVLNYFKIKRIIKENNISHIIIEHPYLGWLGFLLKNFCNVKLVIHSHNIEHQRFKSLNKKWWFILKIYEKWVHRMADYSFFITENDRQFALEHFEIKESKSTVITYGFDLKSAPTAVEKENSIIKIRKKLNINTEDKILLFNGTLSYKANLRALDIILNELNPFLIKSTFKYKIIVCGKDLPEQYDGLKNYSNIIYAGFVDDIKEFYLVTDIFINPVNDGGGIKTKIVEALGYNVSLVTTKSGAIGIPKHIVGGKMVVIDDNDIESFAEAILNIDTKINIPQEYFNHFYWGNIIDTAFEKMQQC